jgi:hypothetical protein
MFHFNTVTYGFSKYGLQLQRVMAYYERDFQAVKSDLKYNSIHTVRFCRVSETLPIGSKIVHGCTGTFNNLLSVKLFRFLMSPYSLVETCNNVQNYIYADWQRCEVI